MPHVVEQLDTQTDEHGLQACLLAGKYLLNVLRSVGVDPEEIRTQAEAAEVVWPTPWAYDAWSAWHACRVGLRRSGWDVSLIAKDRRTSWRTQGSYAPGSSDN